VPVFAGLVATAVFVEDGCYDCDDGERTARSDNQVVHVSASHPSGAPATVVPDSGRAGRVSRACVRDRAPRAQRGRPCHPACAAGCRR